MLPDRLNAKSPQGHYLFRIILPDIRPDGKVIQIGAESEDVMNQWIEAIRSCGSRQAVCLCVTPFISCFQLN